MRFPYRGAFRAQRRATERPGTAAETGRGLYSKRGPSARPAMCHPRVPGRQGRVCDAPRGLSTGGPVDLSASTGIDALGTQTSPGLFRSSSPHGCLLGSSTAWLTPHLEALMHRHARRCEEALCTLGRNLLRTRQPRRCGRGGCGPRVAMSRAPCSFLPMGNALRSKTPEKHGRRQSAADARSSANAQPTRSRTANGSAFGVGCRSGNVPPWRPDPAGRWRPHGQAAPT
jgi:hypothetical protein